MIEVLLIGGARGGELAKVADFRAASAPAGYLAAETWGGEANAGGFGRRRSESWAVEVCFAAEFGDVPHRMREAAFVSALAARSDVAKPVHPSEDPFLIRVG